MLGYAIKDIIAVDLETDAHLKCSRAHRKWGRPTHYYIDAPDGTYTIHYFRSEVTPDNPQGKSITQGRWKVFGVSAYTDREAIMKANRMFEKKYAKFMIEVYHEQTREEGKDFGRAWWQEEQSNG